MKEHELTRTLHELLEAIESLDPNHIKLEIRFLSYAQAVLQSFEVYLTRQSYSQATSESHNSMVEQVASLLATVDTLLHEKHALL